MILRCTVLLLAMICIPASAENVIVNGNCNAGEKAPVGWRFGTAWPTKFHADWVKVDKQHGRSLHIVANTSGMSGYWGQNVVLHPHTRYRLQLQLRLISGRVLVYVHNQQLNARAYYATAVPSPLAPVFVKPEWIRDARVDSRFIPARRWFTAELIFDSQDGGPAAVSIGSYFLHGEMFFDDITLEPLQD